MSLRFYLSLKYVKKPFLITVNLKKNRLFKRTTQNSLSLISVKKDKTLKVPVVVLPITERFFRALGP